MSQTATRPTGSGDVTEMRRLAQQLESDNPLWLVVFGVFSREFVAFPRFDRGTVLSALYPEALPPRMRRIEAKARPAVDGTALGEAPTVTLRLAG